MKLDDLLQQTSYAPDPDQATLRAGRARVQVAIDNAPVDLASRRRLRRFLAPIVAVAAAAVVIVPVISLDGRAPDASAAAILRQAGQAAGDRPDGWANAPYWHSISVHHQGKQQPVLREAWIGNDRPGALKDPGVDCDGILRLSPGLFTGERVTGWAGLYSLPTDPGPLEAALRRGRDQGQGANADSDLFNRVGDLLSESPAPPALRRALYEVAANIPGVELLGPTHDADGRSGVGIERDNERLIIDVSDGRLLQQTVFSFVATYREQGPSQTAPAATVANDAPHNPCVASDATGAASN